MRRGWRRRRHGWRTARHAVWCCKHPRSYCNQHGGCGSSCNCGQGKNK